MTTTHATALEALPTPRPPRAGPLQIRPLRLSLRTLPTSQHRAGLVDGAWWPYSDDLVTELAPLLEELAVRDNLVHRVSYSLTGWQSSARKVHLAGALVRLGGYRTQPAAVIHLVDSSGRTPLVLVVVPPSTAPDTANAAFRLASASTELDAAGVLRAAGPSVGGGPAPVLAVAQQRPGTTDRERPCSFEENP